MKPKRPIDNSAAFTTLAGVGAAMRNRQRATEGQEGAAAKATALGQNAKGLDITKYALAGILSMTFFIFLPWLSWSVNDYNGWIDAPSFISATLGNWLIAILLMLFGSLACVGMACALFANIPRFVGVKMRARVYDMGSIYAASAGTVTPNPAINLIYTAIMAPLFFALVYPFFLLQNVYEVFRVTGGMLTGKSVSFRGDSGRFYDRMRKTYAQMLAAGATRGEAQDMLRQASIGMFTARDADIPLSSWLSGTREQVLDQMIQRHGPIEHYVGKVSPLGSKMTGENTSNLKKNKDGIPDKYTAF